MTNTKINNLPFLAQLQGARVVIPGEIKNGHRLDEALIKDMTGGDPLKVKHLYNAPFEFVPQFKLWMYGNHRPEISGRDNGIWSRIRLIPLLVNIRDSSFHHPNFFEDKLEPELPGILAWAVRGVLDWQQHGLSIPPVIAQATTDYRNEQDVFTEWLANCCERGSGYAERLMMLYSSYKLWCADAGVSFDGRITFSQNLGDEGFHKFRDTNNNVCFQGVHLK